MGKTRDFILKSSKEIIIAIIATGIVAAFGAISFTYFKKEMALSLWSFIFIFFGVILLTSIATFFLTKNKYKTKSTLWSKGGWHNSGPIMERIADYEHDGYEWVLLFPRRREYLESIVGMFAQSSTDYMLDNIDVEGPFCPKDSADLTQKNHVIYGYKILCPVCKSKQWSRLRLTELREMERRILKAQLKGELSGKKEKAILESLNKHLKADW